MQNEHDTYDLLLYEKMNKEQEDFVENLKHLPPDKIIESAYEKVMRDDILMLFEEDFLDTNQIKELLKLKHPLAACYNEWLENDYSHMDMLRDTIEDFSRELVKEHEKARKKKRSEPQR